jgi:DNA-binding FadR family transcriptional regulator
MEDAAARLAWMDVSRADLNFHREICRAADNDIVLTLWEALARHVLIIFGQEIRREHDGADLGNHHRRLRDMLARGDLAGLQQEIEPHILRLRLKPPRSAGRTEP